MASSRNLTRRIKSVGNISKITKAMEMVSASKMRQAQLQALSSRSYSRKLDEILSLVAASTNTSQHPLLYAHTESPKQAILTISTDRGLTGSLNTNLFKFIWDFSYQKDLDFFTVGRLAKEFAIKSNFALKAEFGDIGDQITYESTGPVAQHLIKEFVSGVYSKVWIAYMDFISTLTQKPRIIQLLPIQKEISETQAELPFSSKEYVFEPSPRSILDSLLPYFIELTIYQSLLEARASEHSARMVSMKNASDNAGELVGDLQLQYNRSRQAAITSELSDIVTAMLTLGGN